MTSAVETSALQQAICDLERQLPELTAREERLRSELREVEQRLSSARQALAHLRVLTSTVSPEPAGASAQEEPSQPADQGSGESQAPEASEAPETAQATRAAKAEREAPAPAAEAAGVPKPRTAAKAAGRTRRAAPAAKKPAPGQGKATSKKPKTSQTAAKKKAVAGSRAAAPAAGEGTKVASPLLGSALAILQERGAAMRPAEINIALGREDTAGQRESLRNTLERAVKAGLLKRPERGQYAV
ncbi:hypothetical protein [Streptomyces sp. NPDC018045]|uniref:hypothetical protein n=1 Tax=Streptomyces sp. NPDC018045 TaxID=3365037 RepID=UPI0037A59B81